MGEETRHGSHSVNGGALAGPLWFAGWLFTIGWLKLTFWQAVLGLIIWPYYIGVAVR